MALVPPRAASGCRIYDRRLSYDSDSLPLNACIDHFDSDFRLWRLSSHFVAAFFVFLLGQGILNADGLELNDGLILPGKVGTVRSLVPSTRPDKDEEIHYDWLHVADEQGLIRRYVPFRRDQKVITTGISLEEQFRIRQKAQGRNLTVQQVGLVKYGEWDSNGRRTATLTTPGGKELEVIQAITNITPKLTTVDGMSHYWKTGVGTSTIPPDILRSLLHASINDRDHLSRLKIARFFNQAQMFSEANRELNEVLAEFPKEQQIIQVMHEELIQSQAQFLLDELRIRYDKGQYETVLTLGAAFPEESISGGLLEQVQELVGQVRKRRDQIEEVRLRLSELESKIDPDLRPEVAAWRGVISEQLSLQNIDQMQSFLTLSQGDSVEPDQLISLALSGWILGSDNANTDLPTTLQLWKSRFQILEYLKATDENRRKEILQELSLVPSLTSETLSHLLVYLPQQSETPNATGGGFLDLEAQVPNDTQRIKYTVSLPPEYSPGRVYPLVIELGPKGMSSQRAVEWWAGTRERPGKASRYGWIVVAPEYDENQESGYRYSQVSHQIVLQTIRDVRKRFSVDSNRVFLAGHGKGGEAAWDIGLAHPDLFAGVIPISAAIPEPAIFTRGNGKYCPLYIVGGELDPAYVAGNSQHVQSMVQDRHDLVYVEYLGHGREHFYTEIDMLLDWMSRKQRQPYPREFSIRAVRPGDTQYWWWQLASTPEILQTNATIQEGEKPKVITLTGRVFHTNALEVKGGSRNHVISLSPEMIDFDKRLEVRVGSAIKFNNFLKPSLEAMLEDFRINADRQRLVWARLEI